MSTDDIKQHCLPTTSIPPSPSFCPSLISLVVSVDIKHHVYCRRLASVGDVAVALSRLVALHTSGALAKLKSAAGYLPYVQSLMRAMLLLVTFLSCSLTRSVWNVSLDFFVSGPKARGRFLTAWSISARESRMKGTRRRLQNIIIMDISMEHYP